MLCNCGICVHAGEVLMLTTPEAPQNVLSKMRTKTSRIQGILHGYYRVTGDQVSGQACLGQCWGKCLRVFIFLVLATWPN